VIAGAKPSRNSTAERVGRAVGRRLTAANIAAAVLLWAYLELTLGLEGHRASGLSFVLNDVVPFLVVIGFASTVSRLLTLGAFVRRVRWVDEDRAPSSEERSGVLAEPLVAARGVFAYWAIGAALFAAGDALFGHSAGHDLRVATAILLAGVTTSALSFLLVERACRPLFAQALAGEPPARPAALGVRPRLLLAWVVGSGVPLLGLALVPVTHEHSARVGLTVSVVLLACIGLAAGSIATAIVARSLAEPIDEVRRAVGRVHDGDLGTQVAVDDGGEVGMLQSGVKRMVEGLRERERLHDLFGRHVGVEVARQALEQATGLGGEQREVSVLFVDLIGSSALAEVLPPAEVVDTLNAFFAAVVAAAAAQGGWVNKFEGDGALCVFGAPATQPDHAARALRAARDLVDRLRSLAAVHPGLDAGIGVSSGAVVAGNVGTEQRYEYTVIGRPVNEAARLTELAKDRETRVLAGDGALSRAGEESGRWASLGNVALRGHSAPVGVFEPRSPRAAAR
jgi:adenylate cyclase